MLQFIPHSCESKKLMYLDKSRDGTLVREALNSGSVDRVKLVYKSLYPDPHVTIKLKASKK